MAAALLFEPVDGVADDDDASGDNRGRRRGCGGGDDQRGAAFVGAVGDIADLHRLKVHMARNNSALRVIDLNGARNDDTGRQQGRAQRRQDAFELA